MRQRSSSPSCTQRTPAGLPLGIPGIGLVIEGAVQQAPHCGRQEKDTDMESMDCGIEVRQYSPAPHLPSLHRAWRHG